MDQDFKKSLLYSTLTHAFILLLFILIYRNFLVIRTPLLMELTLIGQMSQGSGLGSPAPQSGEMVHQLPVAESDGEFSTPRSEMAKPSVQDARQPDLSVKRPPKTRKNPGAASSEAYLESLRKSAPIGLNPRKDVKDEIKTTAGLGHVGVAGTPDGSPQVEGELAARNIRRQVNPEYPDWARKQGIEATIRFRLTVLPNGLLREDELQVEQTSGYRELDRVVYAALIQWEFDPLPPELSQADQSGVINFSFSLKNH